MINKKTMLSSTEIRKEGKNYVVTNQIISLETDIDLGVMMLNQDIQELVALLSVIYMKVGREIAVELIKKVIPNARM